MKITLFSEKIYLKPHAKEIAPVIINYLAENIVYYNETGELTIVPFSDIMFRKLPNNGRPIIE